MTTIRPTWLKKREETFSEGNTENAGAILRRQEMDLSKISEDIEDTNVNIHYLDIKLAKSF